MKYFYTRLIFIGLLVFSRGISFGQQGGVTYTDRSSPFGIVSFSAASQLTEISNTTHIDGYVKKYGNGPFSFPVGHKGFYRPFAANTDGTIGAYFQENPNVATLPTGGPFLVSNIASSLGKVSTKEYWDINGSNQSSVTLSWDVASGVASLTDSALSKLTIVGWNIAASEWEPITSTVDAVKLSGGVSTISNGSITTVQEIVPNNFSVYTLGALISNSVPVSYGGILELVNCTEIKGWVWDQNYPNADITVELFEGDVIYATTKANIQRADLPNSGPGSGRYGFSIATPVALNDGAIHQLGVRVKNSNFVLASSPRSLNCAYEGSFETADCYAIKGWVWDRNNPNSALNIEILEGNTVVATTLANLDRTDINVGTGKYGFDFELPIAFRDGQPHQFNLRIKGTTFNLSGSPRTVNCQNNIYNGNFEVADCSKISGWVSATNYPNSAVDVELVEGNNVVVSATANIYRADLNMGTKKYGFSIAIPSSLKNGQSRVLSVRVKGSTYVLSGSPKTVTCAAPAQYAGDFELLDCNTIKGWAWASNYPDTSMTVEVLEGTSIRATVVANIFRQDLFDSGKGNGKYGFTIPLPALLRNGQARQLSIRIKGTIYTLSGSPKTVTCAAPAIYNGNFEIANCDKVSGWASASNYLDSAVVVELVEGSNVVAIGTANLYRGDLSMGTKKYGFNIALPSSLKNGQARQLSVRIKGTTYVLPGSTKTVTCASPAQYAGDFELLDCNTIKG
ncbi:hypothetical protein SAMN05660293_05365, partial [Dyadobacter psychrophilus]